MVGRRPYRGTRCRASAPRARADSHEPHPRDVGVHAGGVDAEVATPRRPGRPLLWGRGRRLHVSPGLPALDGRPSRRRRGLPDGDQHRRVERPPDAARSARPPRSPVLLPLFPHGRIPAAGVLHGAPGGPVAPAGRPAAVHHQLVRRRRPGHERGADVPVRTLDHRPRGSEPRRGNGLRLLHEPHGPSRTIHLPDGGLAPAHPVDTPSRAPGCTVARCRAARRRALGPDAVRDLSDLRPRVCPDGLRGGIPPAPARRAHAPPDPPRHRRPAPVRRGRRASRSATSSCIRTSFASPNGSGRHRFPVSGCSARSAGTTSTSSRRCRARASTCTGTSHPRSPGPIPRPSSPSGSMGTIPT